MFQISIEGVFKLQSLDHLKGPYLFWLAVSFLGHFANFAITGFQQSCFHSLTRLFFPML